MSIVYGDVADPLAAAAEIVSDFDPEDQDDDLEEVLLDAIEEWTSPLGTLKVGAGEGRAEGSAETVSEAIDVVVPGSRRSVSMLRRGESSAFQVVEEGVRVSVFARHMGPGFPEIVRLTELEPMISAMENIDKEVIAAALAESRRRLIEQIDSELVASHDCRVRERTCRRSIGRKHIGADLLAMSFTEAPLLA